MLSTPTARAVLGVSVAGIAGICWSVRDVKACDIPEDSLLNYVSQTQKVWYSDCYSAPVRKQERRVGNAGAVDALCKAFFRCARVLLKLYGFKTLFSGCLYRLHMVSCAYDPRWCASP